MQQVQRITDSAAHALHIRHALLIRPPAASPSSQPYPILLYHCPPHSAPDPARIAFGVVSGVTAVLVLVGSAWYTKSALTRRLARVEVGSCKDTDTVRGGRWLLQAVTVRMCRLRLLVMMMCLFS